VIAGPYRARRFHDRVEPEIGIVPVLEQCLRDLHVACAGPRIDIRCRATFDPVDALQFHIAQAEPLSHPVMVLEGGEPFQIDIAAKAQGVDMRADLFLQRPHACHVDERDEFCGRVRMREAGRMDKAGAAPQFLFHVGGHEILQCLAAFFAHQVRGQLLFAVLGNVKRRCRIVEAGLQLRQPFVTHQHQKLDLGKMLRVFRVEIMFAILDGKGPVPGKGAPRLKPCLCQRFW